MKTPHVHAELIKAWADGAEIQRLISQDWQDCITPVWVPDNEYRIKPEPKPDFVYYVTHDASGAHTSELFGSVRRDLALASLKLTFDGETLKLKSAEVL